MRSISPESLSTAFCPWPPPEQAQDKPIEIIRLRDNVDHMVETGNALIREDGRGWNRIGIGVRAAQELRDGEYVNLGVGIPTEAASLVPEGISVVLHGENGILNIGPFPTEDEVNADLINPGKATTTLKPGGATFSSSPPARVLLPTDRSRGGGKDHHFRWRL